MELLKNGVLKQDVSGAECNTWGRGATLKKNPGPHTEASRSPPPPFLAGDPFPVPHSVAAYCEAKEIAQHLLSQAVAISEGSITLSPLELGEVWKVLSVLSV